MLQSDELEKIDIEWKLKNFGTNKFQYGEKIETPSTTADGLLSTRWTLIAYPHGKVDPKFLSCFLLRDATDQYGPPTIYVEFSFSLITVDGKITHKTSEREEFKRNSCFGCPKFVKLDDIFGCRELFLQSDALTIKCSIQRICATDKQVIKNICRVQFPIDNLNTSIRLDNFRSTTKQNPQVYPLKFSSNLLCLKISLNTDKPINQSRELTYEESFLLVVITKKTSAYPAMVYCWLKLVSNDRDVVAEKKVKHLFSGTDTEEDWILPYFIDTDNLPSNCTVNETLLLDFELSVSIQQPEPKMIIRITSDVSKVYGKESTLMEDLEDLYKTRKFSDIILRVKEELIPVHKSILAARSARFENIFRAESKETTGKKQIIEIVDVDKNTFVLLLKFIYNDKLEDMSDQECLSLYSAARQYQISSLQIRCLNFLKKNLTLNIVLQALVEANKSNDSELTRLSLGLILKHHRYVKSMPEWRDFSKDQEELAHLIESNLTKDLKFD